MKKGLSTVLIVALVSMIAHTPKMQESDVVSVLRMPLGWLVALLSMKDVWRFVYLAAGALCVMMDGIAGTVR